MIDVDKTDKILHEFAKKTQKNIISAYGKQKNIEFEVELGLGSHPSDLAGIYLIPSASALKEDVFYLAGVISGYIQAKHGHSLTRSLSFDSFHDGDNRVCLTFGNEDEMTLCINSLTNDSLLKMDIPKFREK